MRSLETTDIPEEVSAETGMQKWDEEQRPDTAVMKQEGIQQGLQEDPGLEIRKRAVEISSGLQTVKEWTVWRGRPPPKWIKEGKIEQEPPKHVTISSVAL
jgi:hypothetical protein